MMKVMMINQKKSFEMKIYIIYKMRDDILNYIIIYAPLFKFFFLYKYLIQNLILLIIN